MKLAGKNSASFKNIYRRLSNDGLRQNKNIFIFNKILVNIILNSGNVFSIIFYFSFGKKQKHVKWILRIIV